MLKWGIALSVFAGLAIALVVYNRLDHEIRRQVELRLERHYQGLRVRVRTARLIHGEGIEVRGLSILDPNAKGPQLELISVDELFLGCKAEPQDLIAGKPDISHVVLRGMTLFATHRGQQRISSSQLLPLPWVSDGWPTVVVENSAVEILDPLRETPSAMRLSGLNLVLTPGDAPAEPGASPAPAVNGYRVRGSIGNEHLSGVEVTGTVNYKGGGWDLSGKVGELDFTPEFVATLPGWYAEHIQLLAGLRASTALKFRLTHDPAAPQPLSFDISGECQRGRIDDPRLPFPLVDVRADWRCLNGGVELRELTARNGDMTLWLAGQRAGMSQASPWSVRVVGKRVTLDRRLAEADACPRSWRDYWDRFMPSGAADVEATLHSDGQTVAAEDVTARLINVAFTYQEFPYRLERGAGSITWRDQRLSAAVKAYAADEEVRVDAAWNGGLGDGHGWLRCKVDELPVDQKLVSALKPEVREAIGALRARGACNVQALFEQPPPVGGGPRPASEYRVQVALNRCALKYQRFPYPLDDVRGTIEVQNGRWTFGPLTGSNDTGLVECVGHLEPTLQGSQLVLQLTGNSLPLEEELRDALVDPQQRRLWDDLHPQGAVNVRCQISHLSGQPGLHLWARVRPVEGAVSVQPKWFPYRLDNVGGEVFFQDGHVNLNALSAQHGRTRVVEASGAIDFSADGSWRVDVSRLSIDRLELNRELTAALPERFRGAVRELDPQGLINLTGRVQMSSGPEVSSPVKTQWKLALDVHNGQINPGIKLEHLFGGTTLEGSYDGRRLFCNGELDFDSVTYKELQFTNVRGPLVVDDARIVLGVPAERGRETSPRHVTADVCGGTLYGDCGMMLHEPRDYRLDATLVQADLKRISQEILSGRQELDGKVMGQVHLAGRGRGAHNLRGYGELQLREADVYHLPAMVRLFSVLSVKQPDRTAFTESNVNFHIEAGHVYFDAIDFKGDAVSLRGKGEMNLDAVLALNFYAVVGRDQVHLPLVGGVLRGASQQIMQIRVDGKLSDPEIRKLALPGVKKGLERLGIEMGRQSDRPPDGTTVNPARGAWLPRVPLRR